MNLNKILIAIGICRVCVIGLEIPEPLPFIEIDIQYTIQFRDSIDDTSTDSQKTKSDSNEIKEPIKTSPMEWWELQEMAMKLDEYDKIYNDKSCRENSAIILQFCGNGQRNSGIFYLTGNNPKRIRYTYRAPRLPGQFQIGFFAVYIVEAGVDIMVDGGFPEIMTTRSFEGGESSIYKKPGAYHLTILSSGDWTVTIEEKIKK